MAKIEQFIRLLIIEDSNEDAEQIVSQLRNGGITVRPQRPENPDNLNQLLQTQEFDLVLAKVGSKLFKFEHVVDRVEQDGKDRPVVALLQTVSSEEAVRLMQLRVNAFALRNNPEHLQTTVKNAFQALVDRRSLRKLDAALKESERRCEALLDSSRDPIAFVHEGMHVRANKAYLEIFDFDDFSEIEGLPLLDMIAPEAAEGFKNLLKRFSKGEKPPAKLEIKAQDSKGKAFDAVMEFTPATFEGEPCFQITFRQNSGNVVQNLDHDLVTNLYNRRHLLRELDRAVSEAAEGHNDLALLYLEPDNYRNLLDVIGLSQSDFLLSNLADQLRRHAEDNDIAARFSDNGLMLLMKRIGHEDAVERAHAIRHAFEEHIFEGSGKSFPTPISVGLVLIGEKIANAESILIHAAQAVKQVQEQGGNQVRVYDPAARDKADAQAEKAMLSLIQDALKHNKFNLLYQPIISLHGSEGEFYEVLLRMQGPNGDVQPNDFLPIATKYNLLPFIDRWVVGNAIKTIAEREKNGHEVSLFIKLTVQSLADPNFIQVIVQQLKAFRVNGIKLIFEMPESKATTNLKAVKEFIRLVSQLHCAFAIQQFGGGLNSFQLLKHIDAKYIKIDQAFMTDFSKSKDNQQRVKDICEQAHASGRLTIAEFVEDASSMSILFTLGVNFVQGKFLQEPEKVMSYDFG